MGGRGPATASGEGGLRIVDGGRKGHRRGAAVAQKGAGRCCGGRAVPHVCGDAGGLRAFDAGDRISLAVVLRVGCRKAGKKILSAMK